MTGDVSHGALRNYVALAGYIPPETTPQLISRHLREGRVRYQRRCSAGGHSNHSCKRGTFSDTTRQGPSFDVESLLRMN